jgi:hypothetical protein
MAEKPFSHGVIMNRNKRRNTHAKLERQIKALLTDGRPRSVGDIFQAVQHLIPDDIALQEYERAQRMGRRAGRKWATNYATASELERLAKIGHESDKDWLQWFSAAPHGRSAGEFLYETIQPEHEEGDAAAARAFWQQAGVTDEDSECDVVLTGFAQGALSLHKHN